MEFKTAEELGINPWEREQLELILPFLDTVPHSSQLDKAGFNLDITTREYSCGTIACIGGWCALNAMGYQSGAILTEDQVNESSSYVEDSFGALRDLYYPKVDTIAQEDFDYSRVTPAEAKQAVINYLTTGDAQWSTIITEEKHTWRDALEEE